MRSATAAAGTLLRPGPSGPERPRGVRQLPEDAPGKCSAAERAKPRTGGTARSSTAPPGRLRPAPGCRRRRPSRPVRGHGTGPSPMPHPGPPVLSIASSRSTGRSGKRSNRRGWPGMVWKGRRALPCRCGTHRRGLPSAGALPRRDRTQISEPQVESLHKCALVLIRTTGAFSFASVNAQLPGIAPLRRRIAADVGSIRRLLPMPFGHLRTYRESPLTESRCSPFGPGSSARRRSGKTI